jgi:hypothetical protein
MSEPATCDHCEGRGWWRSGCDGDVDCYECQGTGIARQQGNCEDCLGWGWSITAQPCRTCDATGAVNLPVALYWCAGCSRTIAGIDDASAMCPRDADHRLERRTGRVGSA